MDVAALICGKLDAKSLVAATLAKKKTIHTTQTTNWRNARSGT